MSAKVTISGNLQFHLTSPCILSDVGDTRAATMLYKGDTVSSVTRWQQYSDMGKVIPVFTSTNLHRSVLMHVIISNGTCNVV